MTCIECEMAILDSVGPDGTSAAAKAHLAECANCLAFFDTQQRLDSVLRLGLSCVHPSETFRDQLRGRIRISLWLDRLRGMIVFLEFISYLLLAGTVVFALTGPTLLSWLDPRLYLPAFIVSASMMAVRELVSGENFPD